MQSNTYSDESHAFIWNGSAYQKLTCNDILWIEDIEHKIRIVSHNQHYWLETNLDEIHKLLPCSLLKRVHPLFIVNLKRIDGFEGTNILIRQKSIPIGEEFLFFFNEHYQVAPNILISSKPPSSAPKINPSDPE